MKKIFFFIILTLTTFTLGYAFVYVHFLTRSFPLFYLQEENDEKNLYCHEQITIDQSRFSLEDSLFTVLNNMIGGPKNIYLDSAFTTPINIRKVYLLDNTLIIDFNRFLTEINAEEEENLLTVFINGLHYGFPEIDEMIWLSEGRRIRFINAGYSYYHSIRIPYFTTLRGITYDLNPKVLSPC